MRAEFSSLKAAWHIDKIRDLRDGKDVVPSHVQIIISDLCNQNCHFCAYRMDSGFSTSQFADEEGNRNPNRRISYEKCIEIIGDCADLGVEAIEFTGGGEPTVHPKWKEIIGYAQERGMQTGLVTNGIRLEACDAVRKLTWLRISLDAACAETYEHVRESKSWNKAMNALNIAGQLEKPYCGVGFVVTRENYLELAACAELVRGFGIPYIRISAMFSHDGDAYYEGLVQEISRQRAKAKALETDRFKIVDFFDDRVGDLASGAPDYSFCGYQQFVLYIGGNQKVYTCCTNAYTPHGEIGDLSAQSFKSWLSSHRRFDYDARKCHHCQFNDKNRVINYFLEKKPAHVGFV